MRSASKYATQRPVSRFVDAGRWVVVAVVVGNLAVTLLASMNRQGSHPQAAFAQLVEAAASITLLWNPALGLVLGTVPLGMTLAWGPLDAEGTISLFAAGVVAFAGRWWQIVLLTVLELAYAAVRDVLWGRMGEAVSAYALGLVVAVGFGLVLRALMAKLLRGEHRLEVLAADAMEIRSGERVHLAGELRSLVSDRLMQAWGAHHQSTGADAAGMRASLEGVRVACLDAVTRVRALVGMLREEPVADGSDESLAAPKVSEVVMRTVDDLRALGIAVHLQVDHTVDERKLVTQLTVTRLVEWLGKVGKDSSPSSISLTIAAPYGGVQVDIAVMLPGKIHGSDRQLLRRLGERVTALGGTLRTSLGADQHYVLLDLDDTLVPPAPRRAVRDWRAVARGAVAWIPVVALVALAAWTGMSEDFGWPLVWAGLAYISVPLLHWKPLVGALPAIVSVIGMVYTPHGPPIAMFVVVFAGTWEATRTRNRNWTAFLGSLALTGMLALGLLGGSWNLELAVALATLSFGLIFSVIVRQYQRVRSDQVEQTQVLVEAVDHARLEERNLLARELHDVLAHHLSVILLQCMAYGDSDDPEELTMVLGRIGKSLKSAEDELALLTSVMSTGDNNVKVALVRPTTVAGHLKGTLDAARFDSVIEVAPAADDLPPITQRTLTRVMQEGVTNILRYAKRGGRCRLELTVSEEDVRLRVSSELPDSRRGSQLSLGLGLAGIRERVDLSGGLFKAGPEDGQWVVEITLPSGDREAESLGGVSAYTRVT